MCAHCICLLVFSCLHLVLVQKVRKFQKIENTQASLLCMVYVSIFIPCRTSRSVLLSQFEWNSRDSPTETRHTDRYRSLSFVTPANFPRAVTVRRMANDVTYTMYAALPIHLRVQSMGSPTHTPTHTHTHTHTHFNPSTTAGV